MNQRPTLSTRVRKATLNRFTPIITIVSVILILFSFALINYQVTQTQQTRLQAFADQYFRAVETLNEQVQSLARNDLIINSLIDFSNRDSYLPVFFRSLKPTNHISDDLDFSIVFTDFEGEVIAGNNINDFAVAELNYEWKEQVFDNSKPFLSIKDDGLFIVHPVIYSGTAEGSIAAHIQELASILRVNASEYSLLLSKDSSIIFQAGTRLHNFSVGSSFDDHSDTSGLISNGVRIPVINSDASDDPAQEETLTLTLLQPYWSAYSDAGWVTIGLMIVLVLIFVSTLFSIQLTSTIASNIINQLRTQIASARGAQGDFKAIEGSANESREIFDLRKTFNSVMQELLNTTDVKDRVEAVINSLEEMLVVFDLDGNQIIANKSFVRLCSSNGLLDSEDHKTLFPKGFITPEPSLVPTVLRHKDNTGNNLRSVSWMRAVFRDQDGKAIGTVVTGVDITESVQLQKELSLKNKAIDEARTPIIISDAQTPGFPVIYVNRAFEEQTGYTLDEVQGTNCRFLQGKETDPKDVQAISSALRELKPITTTILNYRKDGTEFYNRLALAPIHDDEGKATHFLGFQSDITDQERTQQFLEQARQKAEDSAKLKSEFLASMSHEIRTPMNGILGMLGLLESTELSREQDQHVRLAKSSADALLVLINDILDFSKIEAGKLTLEHVKFDMLNLVSEVASSVTCVAEDKRLEVVLDVADAHHRQILGDPGRIRQVLNNLIGNAIKFTTHGYVLISARSRLDENNRCIYEVAIKDTGVGIPADRVDHIFDSFSQVDASTTRKFGGTGLGLTICKQLTELMDGDILVESELGQGSTFTMQFITEHLEEDEAIFETEKLSALRIAHLDSSDPCLESVRKQLSNWEIESNSFQSRDDLLKHLNASHIDVLLFSSAMNGKDTAKLCSEFRQSSSNPEIKLCMLTSMSELQHASKLGELGVDAYFPKPVTQNELHDALVSLTTATDENTQSEEAGKVKVGNYEGIHVLLVEDNPINQILAVTLLEGLGLQVEVANDGQEALDKLNEDVSYQLIFMDCQMPVMDGYQATRHIRTGDCGEAYTNIPIIAMTANAIAGDREKCLDAGMSDYITKPIDTALLEKRIAHWCSVANITGSPQDHDSKDSAAPDETGVDIKEPAADVASEENSQESATTGADASETNEIWDHEAALERTIGREDLLQKVVNAYMKDTPALVDKLQDAIDRENLDDIAYLAHTIKGASLNISAKRLSELAANIEASAKAQQPVSQPQVTTKLQQESEVLFAMLRSHSQSKAS